MSRRDITLLVALVAVLVIATVGLVVILNNQGGDEAACDRAEAEADRLLRVSQQIDENSGLSPDQLRDLAAQLERAGEEVEEACD